MKVYRILLGFLTLKIKTRLKPESWNQDATFCNLIMELCEII